MSFCDVGSPLAADHKQGEKRSVRRKRRPYIFGWVGLSLGLLGCQHASAPPASAPPATPAVTQPVLTPSPNQIVGRILAVDVERGFAFVDLATDAPPGALAAGADLTVRALDLHETGHLRTSAYMRGRTLGTRLLSGQPSPGDEVVWHP